MKRLYWIAVSFLTLMLLIVGTWKVVEPWLLSQALNVARSILKEKANIEFNAQSLNLQLLPPALIVEKAKVEFKDSKLQYIEPITIERSEAQLDFLQLLGGRLSLSLIHLDETSTILNLDKYIQDEKPLEKINLIPLFEGLRVLPLSRILISNMNFDIKKSNLGKISTKSSQVLLKHSADKIEIGAELPSIKISEATQKIEEEVTLELKGFISTENAAITEGHFNSRQSKFSFTSKLDNLPFAHKTPKMQVASKGTLNLEDWIPLLKKIPQLKMIPEMTGSADFEMSALVPKWNDPHLKIKTILKDFILVGHKLETINANVSISKDTLAIPNLEMTNTVGKLWLADMTLGFENNLPIKGNVSTDSFNVQELLQLIGLKSVPVDLTLDGQLSCTGTLESIKVACSGKLNGKDFSVRSALPKASNEIVAINSFSASGQFTADKEKVVYDTGVTMGSSTGSSAGEISYENGFKISYKTPSLDMKNIRNLANLKIEGQAQIDGTTEGTSQFGLIDMKLNTQNFWFEDFALSQINGTLNYKAGIIAIQSDSAQIGNSQYNGEIRVDLNESRLKAALNFPLLETVDVLKSLERKLVLPIEILGRGQAKVDVEGPFHLGGLSYDLKANFKRGQIATEKYDEAQIHLIATNGNVKLGENYILKNKGKVDVTGWATPAGDINLYVDGTRFQLDEIDMLSNLHQYLTGELNFRMKLNNHILNPSISLTGNISESMLADVEMPNSDFSFDLDENAVSGALQMLGNKIRGEFSIPRSDQQKARIKMDTQEWDFATLLALLGNGAIKNEYRSSLTMHINLESSSGGIFQSTGDTVIEKFLLSRGGLSLSNPKPMLIKFNSGRATLEDFLLIGPEAKILVRGEDFTSEKLDLLMQGKIDLKILQVFTPFFDDLGGLATADLKIAGSLFSPEVFGNINSKSFFFKLAGFPHPFEQLNAQIELSQKKIILQSLRGLLAGGQLAADGRVFINGANNFDVNIRARAQGVTLNLPDKMKTSGTAEILITGNWFPYLLSGTYRITQGLITKDFTEEDKGSHSVKHSIYLPQEITKKSFEPINLDMQVIIDRPLTVTNPQINGPITGQLQVKGVPTSPQLLGQIKVVQGAKLLFRDKLFDIQSGLIKFTDPNEINPELYISARSRVDTYDVSLLLQGLAKEPQLLLSSQPPLDNQDIISLLALGVTSQKLDSEISSDQQAAQTSYQIGSAILSANPLGKEIKESTGWDLKLSSSFDDTKNVAIPKATLSKDLNKRVNVSATSSLGQFQIYDVRLQYLINENVSAVGTYEKSDTQENTSTTGESGTTKSVFGLDLEYKMEFR